MIGIGDVIKFHAKSMNGRESPVAGLTIPRTFDLTIIFGLITVRVLSWYLFHEPIRMSELVQLRQRSPWVWLDFMYSLTPSGREHDRCIKILHDFTNKV